MHVAVTRVLTRWFNSTPYGVNALLATVPRKKANGTSSDAKPEKVTIYNDVDFAEILTTGGIKPPSLPALVVVSDVNGKSDDIRKIHVPAHTFTGTAGIGFYAAQTEIGDDIILGDLVLRAVKQSLTKFNLAPQLERELNKILVGKVMSVEWQRVAPAVPESYMLGVLFADLVILDKAP